MARRSRVLLSDALWAEIAPLLPTHPVSAKGGRPWVDDRTALRGILYVLRTGTPWEDFPQELGGCSGMTCWRRLRDWQQTGVWARLHRLFLERLQEADQLDWRRAALDSSSVRAPRGARSRAQTRPIAGRRARSAISSSTPRASRSR